MDKMQNQDALRRLRSLSEAERKLLAAVIGLARASEGNGVSTQNTAAIAAEALRAIRSGGNAACERLFAIVREEKDILAPGCATCPNPCGRTADYPMEEFFQEDEGLQVMKARMLCDIVDHVDTLDFAGDWESLCSCLFMFGYEKDAAQFEAFLMGTRELLD